jgi:glyceraldehyde-3-phosphate dehydrogenase (NADP+)
LDEAIARANEVDYYRLDVMPFGGTKSSGIGPEGIRFSILDMTQPRVVCLNLSTAKTIDPQEAQTF